MLSIYPVDIHRDLDRTHPLYVGHFFPLKGMWWRKRKQRQGLIISMAIAWSRLVRKNMNNPGFLEEEILITSLTSQVKDARVILEHFFNVKRIGFNFGESNKSPSIIVPRRLGAKMQKAIDNLNGEVHFSPGAAPTGVKYTESNVSVIYDGGTELMVKRLEEAGREDLIPPVTWLINEPNPIVFLFEPSGSLQARDKSVWPIKSIETWPGWLRQELFGTVVDIENAFVQYLVKNLEDKYADNPSRMELKFPDLLRADRDKQNFREEICRDLLRLPVNNESIAVVKHLIMSLANGSNATPTLLTNGSGRSEAVRIVLDACPHLSPTELLKVGARLSSITKQFKAAKRDLCIFMLKGLPTRENQKKIFHMYFDWERKARYMIHDAVGGTGLHLHDGLDGVVSDLSDKDLCDFIHEKTSVRVSVDRSKRTVTS
jgi:hypothetical protein